MCRSEFFGQNSPNLNRHFKRLCNFNHRLARNPFEHSMVGSDYGPVTHAECIEARPFYYVPLVVDKNDTVCASV